MILKKIACDIPNCDREHEEVTFGAGFPGWGSVQGVSLNGKDNPVLCPHHLEKLMNIVDRLNDITGVIT